MLRVFLRYAHREGLSAATSQTVGWPQVYRLSSIPRSISWDDVNRVLAGVDRRTPCGKRDYAILLLLVTYGLRGREVAALTLGRHRLEARAPRRSPSARPGHSTAFPLSAVVGEALARLPPAAAGQRRPIATSSSAPWRPGARSGRPRCRRCAAAYLLKAGVEVPRPGSHTLRHSAVQRLVDADFST